MKYLLRKILFFVPYYKYLNLALKFIQITNNLFMKESGILTKKEEKWLSKFLDAAIKFDGLMELVDGVAIRLLVSIADNYIVEEFISEGWKNPLKELVQLGIARDKEGIAALLDSKIDVPFITDAYELIGFNAAVKLIGSKMYAYIDSVEIAEDED